MQGNLSVTPVVHSSSLPLAGTNWGWENSSPKVPGNTYSFCEARTSVPAKISQEKTQILLLRDKQKKKSKLADYKIVER